MSGVTASAPKGGWFVYRSMYEGLAGKRVRRLPDATVVAWFQRMWAVAAAVAASTTNGRPSSSCNTSSAPSLAARSTGWPRCSSRHLTGA